MARAQRVLQQHGDHAQTRLPARNLQRVHGVLGPLGWHIHFAMGRRSCPLSGGVDDLESLADPLLQRHQLSARPFHRPRVVRLRCHWPIRLFRRCFGSARITAAGLVKSGTPAATAPPM